MNSFSNLWTFLFDAIDGRISSLRSLCFLIPCKDSARKYEIAKQLRGLTNRLSFVGQERFELLSKEMCWSWSLKLTRTKGSHAKLFESEDGSSAIPVGGPRKPSQTSLNRDSSASLQSFHNHCLVCSSPRPQDVAIMQIKLDNIVRTRKKDYYKQKKSSINVNSWKSRRQKAKSERISGWGSRKQHATTIYIHNKMQVEMNEQ